MMSHTAEQTVTYSVLLLTNMSKTETGIETVAESVEYKYRGVGYRESFTVSRTHGLTTSM